MSVLAEDPQLVRKVRAAITAKIKPTSMILLEDPSESWRSLDFQLIEALQILEDEVCPNCGHPVWLCRSKNPELTWVTREEVCQASRAVEERQWRESNPKKRPSREDSSSWGSTIYPVPQMIEYPGEDPQPLPSREEYFKSLTVE